MAQYEILVTDVTCYGDLYCVAGWDRVTGMMIRPEPFGANSASEVSRFWDASFAGPGRVFSIGNIVRFEAANPPQDFPFPHRTEDRIVDQSMTPVVVATLTIPQLEAAIAAKVSPSLQSSFGGALARDVSGKASVPAGHRTHSLDSVQIAPENIEFHQTKFQNKPPKLRARITQSGIIYDLPVTADAARRRWLAGGVSGLQADANACRRIHVRIGLSRPFADKPCYVQVNGLFFI
jgi:hypothetical protein